MHPPNCMPLISSHWVFRCMQAHKAPVRTGTSVSPCPNKVTYQLVRLSHCFQHALISELELPDLGSDNCYPIANLTF